MRTNIKTINFKSSNGQDNVSAVVYYPDAQPVRGIVQVCHGLCEHIGRYHDFLLFLAHQGFAAFGQDLLGHGKTAPDADHLGYFAPKNGYQYLIRDAHQLNQIAKNLFPGNKAYLIGHSMGSLVARLYCVKYPDSIDGAVFLGTPGPFSLTAVGMVMAQQAIRRKGPLSRPAVLDKLVMGGFNRPFVPARTPKDWLSRDEAQVDKAMKDPLCSFQFTASGYYDLFSMMEIASSSKGMRDFPQTLPVLILSGDNDPVGGFGRGVLQVYNRLLSLGVQDLTFQLYEGARHELLNELNRQEAYADILNWIERHLSAQQQPNAPQAEEQADEEIEGIEPQEKNEDK